MTVTGPRYRVSPVSFHGYYIDLVPHSYDPLIRETSQSRFRESYENADAVGATHLVMHHGFVPQTMFRDDWIARMATIWKIEILAPAM